MSKKYLLTILVLLAVALLTYYLLGGFNLPKYTVMENHETHIYGTYYEGTLGSDSLKNLFLTARELVSQNEQLEAIAIAYYGDVNQENGFVRNFIGVMVADTTMQFKIPNWKFKSFAATSSIKGCIEANVIAMPTPDDLLSGLKGFGIENNIEPDSIFIEYYAGPNNLCVELLSK